MKTAIALILLLICATVDVSAQVTFSSDDSKKFVGEFQETELIERIDMSRLRVYVDNAAWNLQLNAEQKEMLVCLIADYFKYHHPQWDSDVRPEAELYNNRTARRVAKWSNWSGVIID